MKRRDMLKLTGGSLGMMMVPKLGHAQTGLASAPVPVIPQRDSWVGRGIRSADLVKQNFVYTWNYFFPTVPGAPMATVVPLEDLPTVEWLIPMVLEAAQLVLNFIVSIPGQLTAQQQSQAASMKSQWQSLLTKGQQIQTQFNQLTSQYQNASMADPAALAQIAAMQVQLTAISAEQQAAWPNIATFLQGLKGTIDGTSGYQAMFSSLPFPEAAKPENLHDDNLFAYMRVAGPNPMLLERVDTLPANFPLTAAQYQQVMGSHDSLSAALSSRRLYMVDYVELGSMAPSGATNKLLTGAGYNSAPIALFAVPVGGKSLVPVAIQCGQNPQTNPMFLRPAANDVDHYWGWQMAKTVVQTADFNYHEMFVHLGRTHLISEALHVATRRSLAYNHPLSVLFMPHFEGDLFINAAAGVIIMAPATFADLILAAPLAESQKGAVRDRLAFNFSEMIPTEDFADRGVDDPNALPDYPFRDDALLIWQAIRQWASDYINIYYRDDADVLGDVELSNWVNELRNGGKLQGVPQITTKAKLVDVAAMVMYTNSAQHAAVNFAQGHWMTYAPFMAGMNGADVPKQTTGYTEADWLKMLPGKVATLAQLNFLTLLCTQSYRPLGNYKATVFPYPDWFSDTRVTMSGGPLQRFKQKLAEIEGTINSRNASRTRPYPFLLPSKIPSSINI